MNYRFDLIDLQLIVFVADEGSLTRAATRMHISLPAASVRMKNLESALDLPLFDRRNSGIALLPAGQVLLEHARQVVAQIERLQADLMRHVQEGQGSLRVLANTTAMTEFLPLVLNRFLVDHPNVSFELRERLSEEIVRAVSEGAADVGIVAGEVQADRVRLIPYRSDRLVLISGLAHPLAGKRSVSFSEALENDFIGLHEGSAIHFFLGHAAREARKALKVRIQVTDFETMCRMAESNVGVGVLPEKLARRHAGNMAIHLIRLTDSWASRDLRICTQDREPLPALTQALVEFLIETKSLPL
ncbi:LysR substrate-binding domain-containing protein [Pusillimonas noertemannii]|uniref:LysR substrate-binding domain-containing protein n=1 Tax=Pusillimonas noertemannii TaxID=305977 RepID=UPI00334089F0